jgi:two-component system sensor histidine kinase RpfC
MHRRRHVIPNFHDILRKVRGLAGPKARDPDIEQAWIRVGVCSLATAYVVFLIVTGGGMTPGLLMGLIAGTGDALVGAGMVWWLRRSKAHVIQLRYLGILTDNAALTLGMAGAGEGGVAVVGIYLWVTIGNGFRFGARYLMASYWLSLICFGLQLFFVPYWELHKAVGIGLMISGAIVPLYVLVLIVRLRGQKDAAEQLSNAKSRFVANVSHELRTPLTGVFAVYDLLRGRKMTPDDRELVGMLGSAIKTLKTSVDAVLQMSKLEAGAERAEKRLFNLWYFIQQLATLVRPQSTAKGLAWTLQVDPMVPATVMGDPSHLSHVLGNLLNNAFKFTSSGGVSLRVIPLRESHVRFEVVDTGIGIPLDQQERLFERFVQVDSSATRRHGGTGLGTSIARDLTELMGGKIGVVSAPGQGSTFWVDIPLAEASPARPAGWETWRQVTVVGGPGKPRDDVVQSIHELGLEAVVIDASERNASAFDAQRYLAALIVMPAGAAAAYAESTLREHAGAICPWIVVAPSYTSTQSAALVAGGAAGLLPADASTDEVGEVLGALLYRIEALGSADAPSSLPATGIVRPLTVLLADDNHSNQMLLSRILQNAGHKVLTAERGDRAYDIMGGGGIDLALLDLNMPDMSGPDVVKLFRAGAVGGATKLPIIILSADATPAAKQESIDAGADEFLTKPVSAATLLATIERVVAGNMARSTVRAQAVPDQPDVSPSVTALVDNDRLHALRRIARGDAKFLDTYIGAAFDELERAIDDLRKAVNSSEVRAARDALHIIEGTGASVGAVALVANCKSMRNYLSVPDDPDRAGALAELSTTYMLTKSTVLASLHESRGKATRTGAARD